MKRSIGSAVFAAAFSTGSWLWASTQVPATLNGDTEWDQSGSPYVIQGKTTLPAGMTLQIGPAVKVILANGASFEVDGTLQVQGSAAAPTVFDMTNGGMQNELFINGGDATLVNAKILGGLFLAKDAQLDLESSEITQGSGVYLQGTTDARLKSNKIYGNATGVVLDGQVEANMTFNTLVQNTYGLYLKQYETLLFRDNSIHDNQAEVVNNAAPANVSSNYWGNEDESAVMAKVQGPISLKPMQSLKDVLRIYIQTQLPSITKQQAVSLARTEDEQDREQAIALKKFRKEQKREKMMAAQQAPAPAMPAVAPTPVAVEAAVPTPAPQVQTIQAPAAPAPAVVSAPAPAFQVPSVPEIPTHGMVQITDIPPTPYTLQPNPNIPPEQSQLSSYQGTSSETAAPAPAVAAPSVPANSVPPAGEEAAPASPAAPEAPSIEAPPALGESNPTAAPSGNNGASSNEVVPPPPDLSVPETTGIPAASNVPASPAPSVAAPTPAPTPAGPTEQQKAAVDALQGTTGDIEGMQAPPPDLGLDLSGSSTQAAPSSNGAAANVAVSSAPTPASQEPPLPAASGDNATAPSSATTAQAPAPSAPVSGTAAPAPPVPVPSDSNLTLPPLQDSSVQPPNDLPLPPSDDLGNVNLNSRTGN